MPVLSGEVVSGRGIATLDLQRVAGDLRSLVGQSLVPGSLNVVLGAPLLLQESAAISFDGGRRFLWRAKLRGVDLWIYRWRECPLHVIELLAVDHLRSRFGLKDGDSVDVEIEPGHLDAVGKRSGLVWAVLWSGRRGWVYRHDGYFNSFHYLGANLGAAQMPAQVAGVVPIASYLLKKVLKRIPIVGPFAKSVKSRLAQSKAQGNFVFKRLDTEACPSEADRVRNQILNVLNYTKSSNSVYSAEEFPAAYHTIKIAGQRILGQRDPTKRFSNIPIDFRNKSVLDIGCNQGGMVHEVSSVIKWGVGIDFDARMVNAANRVRSANGSGNTSFYVFDLEKDPLELLGDLLPERVVDVCFLLSVCMWIRNWREVIDFAREHSRFLVFETNGTDDQQREQIEYLSGTYRDVRQLSGTSEDDPIQKARQLFLLSDHVELALAS
jgi:SAM-dependent methyltransferase